MAINAITITHAASEMPTISPMSVGCDDESNADACSEIALVKVNDCTDPSNEKESPTPVDDAEP